MAAAGLGIVVVGLVAWGWYADHAPVTEATTPATAAPPPTATPTPKAAPAAPARQPAPVYQPAPAAATTTVPKVPPRGPRLRPVPLPEGRVAALWTHKDKGRAALDVTHFVDAGGREVGERPGIHLIVGDKLYRWESGERTKAGRSCPPDQPSKFSVRTLHDAALVPVDTGQRIPIGGYPPADKDQGEPDWNVYSPLAILGNVIFVRAEVDFGGCGANHPDEEVEAKVVAVRAGGTTAAIPMGDLRDGEGWLLDDAVKKLDEAVKAFDHDHDVSPEPGHDDVRPSGVRRRRRALDAPVHHPHHLVVERPTLVGRLHVRPPGAPQPARTADRPGIVPRGRHDLRRRPP